MSNARLAVGIPQYKHENCVDQAVQSIRDQTYPKRISNKNKVVECYPFNQEIIPHINLQVISDNNPDKE